MRTASFPTHAEMLEEFAAGMREHKDQLALRSTIDAMNKLSVNETVISYPERSRETMDEAMRRMRSLELRATIDALKQIRNGDWS
jgi:predicted metal-binding protein